VAAPDTYNETDTISDLLEADTHWTLTEPTVDSKFALDSIDCTDSDGGTYHLYGSSTTTVSAFKVIAGATTACVIVNKLVKTTPEAATAQTGFAQIKDAITLTKLTPDASDKGDARVTFALYSANTCIDPKPADNVLGNRVYISDPIALTYSNQNQTATATMLDANAKSIAPGITYYWRVTYTGDVFNNSFTTSCNSETGSVSFTFTP